MKVSANIVCLNEIDYLKYALESVYNTVDKIVIVEGCSKLYKEFANPKGLSTDGTPEMIKAFPDPKDKISYYAVGFCDKVSDLRNFALQRTDKDTDYVLVVDGDTLFEEKEINAIKLIAQKYPNIRAFWGYHLMFFGDMQHILTVDEQFRAGHGYYIPLFLWKYNPNLHYTSRQMLYLDGEGEGYYWRDVPQVTLQELEAGKYKNEGVVLKDILFNIYHYGWVRMKDRLDLHLYQRIKSSIKGAERKINKGLIDKQANMMYALRNASYKEIITWIEAYHKIYTGIFDQRYNEHLEEYLLPQPEAIKKHPWWNFKKSDFGL